MPSFGPIIPADEWEPYAAKQFDQTVDAIQSVPSAVLDRQSAQPPVNEAQQRGDEFDAMVQQEMAKPFVAPNRADERNTKPAQQPGDIQAPTQGTKPSAEEVDALDRRIADAMPKDALFGDKYDASLAPTGGEPQPDFWSQVREKMKETPGYISTEAPTSIEEAGKQVQSAAEKSTMITPWGPLNPQFNPGQGAGSPGIEGGADIAENLPNLRGLGEVAHELPGVRGVGEALSKVGGKLNEAFEGGEGAARRIDVAALKAKPLYEMNPDELAQAMEVARTEDADVLNEVFGENEARRYRRLERTANSPNVAPDTGAAATKEMEDMHNALTEQQQNRLFGIGEQNVLTPEDVADYQHALNRLDFTSPQALGRSLGTAVSRLGSETDPALLTHDEQVAYAQFREAFQGAAERGWDQAAIERAVVQAHTDRFSDPEDAAFILDRIRQAGESPVGPALAAGPRQLSGPQVLTGKPDVVNSVEHPNQSYELQYKVVPLEDLITSQSDPWKMTDNPAFPQELQMRGRERAASRLQVAQNAQQLDPNLLLEDTHTLDRGAPIIGPDNVVESGNGRTLSLQMAKDDHPERWQAYQDALRTRAQEFGIDPAQLDGVQNPVLVRQRTTTMNAQQREQFAQEANRGAAMGLGTGEQARVDAGRLNPTTISNLTLGENQTVDQALRSPSNRDVVRSFMGNVPDSDRATMIDENGYLSREGLARVKQALLVRTYGTDAGLKLADMLTESLDENTKNIETAIFRSLPSIAKAEALVQMGDRAAGLGITDDIARVVNVLARLRQEGTSIADYAAQTSLFGRELNPHQEALLQTLEAMKRSPRRMASVLENYADAVIASPHPDQAEMFGNAVKPTKEGLLEQAIRTAAPDEQANLFAGREAETAAAPASRPLEPAEAGGSNPAGNGSAQGGRGEGQAPESAGGLAAPEDVGLPGPSNAATERLSRPRNPRSQQQTRQAIENATGVEAAPPAGDTAMKPMQHYEGAEGTDVRVYRHSSGGYAVQLVDKDSGEVVGTRIFGYDEGKQADEYAQGLAKAQGGAEPPKDYTPAGGNGTAGIPPKPPAATGAEAEPPPPQIPGARSAGGQPPSGPGQRVTEAFNQPPPKNPPILDRAGDVARAIENQFADRNAPVNRVGPRTEALRSTLYGVLNAAERVASDAAEPIYNKIGTDLPALNEFIGLQSYIENARSVGKEGPATSEISRAYRGIADAIEGTVQDIKAGAYGKDRKQAIIDAKEYLVRQLNGGYQGADTRPVLAALASDDSLRSFATAQQAALSKTGRYSPSGIESVADAERSIAQIEKDLGPERWKTLMEAEDMRRAAAQEWLDSKVRSGRLSQEVADKLQTEIPHYNPTVIEHYLDDVGGGTGQGTQITWNGIKRLTQEGSESDVLPPMQSFLKAMVENEVGNRKNEFIRTLVDEGGFTAKPAQRAVIGMDILTPEERNEYRAYRAQGLSPDEITEIHPEWSDKGSPTQVVTTKPKTTQGVIQFMQNGRLMVAEVPQDIERIVKGLNDEQLGAAAHIAMGMNRFLRVGATQLNPSFLVSNMLADAAQWGIREGLMPQDVARGVADWLAGGQLSSKYIRGGGGYGAEGGWFVGGVGNTIQEALKQDTKTQGWAKFEQEVARKGGVVVDQAHLDQLRRATTLDDIGRALIGLTKEGAFGIKSLGEAIEMGPRLATMEKHLGQGESLAESIQAGRRVTVDFSRMGSVLRSVNAFVPFVNAGEQGLLNTFRTMRDNPMSRFRVAGLTLAAAGIYGYNRQFGDRYDDVPSYIKGSSLVIMLPDGGPWGDAVKNPNGQGYSYNPYVALPLREYANFFTSQVSSALEAIDKHDGKIFVDGLVNGLRQATPASGNLPALAAPLGEAWSQSANFDQFRQRQIVSESTKRASGGVPELEYTPQTSLLARKLAASGFGEALDWSPQRIDHFVEGLTGGGGKAAVQAVSTVMGQPSDRPPVIGGLLRTPYRTYGGQVEQAAYDRRDEAIRGLKGEFGGLRGWMARNGVPVSEPPSALRMGADSIALLPGEQAFYYKAKMVALREIAGPDINNEVKGLSPQDRQRTLRSILSQASTAARLATLDSINDDELRRRQDASQEPNPRKMFPEAEYAPLAAS